MQRASQLGCVRIPDRRRRSALDLLSKLLSALLRTAGSLALPAGAMLLSLLAPTAALADVTLSGQFAPLTISQGDRTRMRINFQNNDFSNPVTAANFTNILPAPLQLYSPAAPGYVAPTSNCNSATVAGQTVVSNPPQVIATAPNQVQLSNGTVPQALSPSELASCFIEVDVTAQQAGTFNNELIRGNFSSTPPVSVPGTDQILFSLNVSALNSPTVSKSFGTNPLVQGNTTTVTITISNPNSGANLPLTTFSDTLPANLIVEGTPAASCSTGGTNPTVTSGAGANPIAISGGTIAANGSCTITATVRGTLGVGVATSAQTNSIPANAVGNTRGLPSASSDTPITVNSPFRVSKSFSPNPLSVGQAGSATVTIFNDSAAPVTGVSLSDTTTQGWPAGIVNRAGSIGLSGCGTGIVAAGPGGANGQGFVLSGAQIAAGATCAITVPVTAATTGDFSNTIPQGAVGNDQGFVSPAASAPLNVRNTEPLVVKSVSPASAAPGDIVTYTVGVTNFNPAAQTGVTFTDSLPGGLQAILTPVPGGAAPVLGGAGCTNLATTGTASSPTFTFDMPAAAPGGSACSVTFQARVPPGAAPGTSIGANATGSITNSGLGINSPGASSGGIAVLQPLQVAKTFDDQTALTLAQGTPARLTITLTNNNFSPLTGVTLTDTLPGSPGPIVVANPPNASTTCGGTLTAVPGTNSVALAGGTIAARNSSSFAPGSCVINVSVVGGTASIAPGHVNTIPAAGVTANIPAAGPTGNSGSPIPISNTAAASASLQYTPVLTAAKTFLTNPVNVGGVSRVRITLGNSGPRVLTNVSVNDPLPAGTALAAPPNATTTCTGPTVIGAAAGGTSATLTGAAISPGGSCDFLFDVVATNANPSTNTIPAGNITADGGIVFPNPVSATLNKSAGAVAITKSFTPNNVDSPGQPARLQISITNTGALALTNLGLPDPFPAGMQVAAVPNATTTCPGGVVSAAPGAASISLSGASLGANGASCVVAVDVVHLVIGTLTNTIPAGAVTNAQGISNATAFSANLASQQNVGVQKSFSPPAVGPGTPARLTLRFNNTLGIPLTGLSVTDNLPAGLTVAPTPNAATTCAGATITSTANSVTLSGANLPVGPSSCTLSIDVVAAAAGTYLNTIPVGGVTSNGGAVSNPAPATVAPLNVLNPATIAKAFSVSPVAPGGISRLTVTINNPNAVALTNAALTDNLPSGYFIAQTPNTATTCAGGVVSAAPSGTSVRLTGATVPLNGSCTFSVDTLSNTPGTYTNTIPANALASDQGVTNPAPASAPVVVLRFPAVSKSFNPQFNQAGATSTLTISLENPNSAPLTLTQNLDDNLPAGLVVAPTPAVAGTCPGLPGTVTAAAGGSLVRYNNGASIPAGGCTISVNVTSAAAATYTNTIPAGGLSTNAGPNQEPATATVVFSPLGSISGRIYRDNNNNGAPDPGETGIGGQTVELLDAGGNVVQTTTTDPSGNYVFTGLGAALIDGQSATFTVRQPTQPAGTLNGKTTAGTIIGSGTPGTASGVATLPSVVSSITLTRTAGVVGSSPNNNFGELVPSQVSGTVFNDPDNNGVQEPGESGFQGVPITLSGFDDRGQPVVLNTVTDASGNYAFPGLRPSCGSPGAAACPGGSLPGYTITEGTQPNGTQNGREVSGGQPTDLTSGAGVGTAGTISNNNAPASGNAPAGTSRIQSIILPPNAGAANNNFAEIGSNRSISGRIFTDNNGNGVFDPGDAGVGAGAAAPSNVAQTLRLTGTAADGTPVDVTVQTDANGNYTFANLKPGSNYTVTCTTCPPPAGFANGAAYPGSTGGAAGGTQAAPSITGIDLSGPNSASTGNNFTKTRGNGVISGKIYLDNNNDGIADAGEAGITGQTVRLLDSLGNQVATTNTAADGSYSFPGLAAGTYTVEQPTQPPNTLNGRTTSGTITGTGTPGTATPPTTVPSRIANIILQGAAGNVASSPNNNFGELVASSIAGSVYHDVNGNASKGNGEGLGGVTITLTGTDDRGAPVSQTTTTAPDGSYIFEGLRPGTYTVTETQPAGISDDRTVAGSAGGTAGVNVISAITLPPATQATGYDFLENASSIAGAVYLDANNNGQRDPGEEGIPGVTVTLSGGASRTATTDAQGNYLFAGLPAGSYTVSETQPVLFADGLDRAGSAGGAAGNDVISGIPLGAGVNATNYEFGERPGLPGTISGSVWLNSVTKDAVRQPGEPPKAGWMVELVRNGQVVQRTNTDADGNYSFATVPAGTGYEIVFRNPANNAVFGNPVSDQPGADTSGGTIRNLTVGSGANIPNQNLPIDPSGVVYNSVTREPIAGATVTINGPPGFENFLVGGPGNRTQVTGPDGLYQYFLLPGAPLGPYSYSITAPSGFAPGPSVIIPACTATLSVLAAPNPTLVQNALAPPPSGAPQHNPAACPANSAGLAAAAGSTQYYLSFLYASGALANLLNNNIPLDPILGGAIVMTKTTPLVNVTRGELVPYTVTARNTLNSVLPNIDVRDQIPPGFKYRSGSATLNGKALEPAVAGRELTWRNQPFAPNEVKTYKLILVVGSGVGEGEYTNQAFALNSLTNATVSNVATATVRIVPDPTFDCTDIIGKVFDDQNANGYQDDGEPGIPNVRIATARGLLVTTDAEGRFHVPCAVIPNPDRGSNFVMKLDERTLPSGYRLTTENPRAVRATRGKMTKLNFGATIHRVVRIEVSDAAFEPGKAVLLPDWRKRVEALPEKLKEKPSVVRIAYVPGADPAALAEERVKALRDDIRKRWEQLDCCYRLVVETEDGR